MFFHNLKYTGLSLFKKKTSLFWTLVFPIALSTFMYVAFGKIYENDTAFKNIEVAVVDDGENVALMEVLNSLNEGEDRLLDLRQLTDEEARKSLSNEEVAGIIYTKDISLVVRESSVKSSILETVLKQYKQKEYMINDVVTNHPEKIGEVAKELTESREYFKETSTMEVSQNLYNNYFFAILAMSCMFAAFSSVESTSNLLANASNLGMRKSLAPHSKMPFIVSEYVVMLFVHFIVEVLALGYMSMLGVNFGAHYPQIIMTLFVGCMTGLSLGVIIGAIPKISLGAKVAISVAVGMALSVMADLCIVGIKDLIERNIPILNRLNPAVLITQCLYSLNMYDNYDKFIQNITILVIEAVVLVVLGFVLVRREKYASV